MNKKKPEHEITNPDYYNATSNTEAGINTPRDREDIAVTDMISEAVGEMVDNIQHSFEGKPRVEKDKRERQE
ncbi:hypothetical protein ACFOLF_15850 [Paenibacillus sepulcri]|uniref:DUF4025 domain-containing protein n=1 Tax=Paenibacillus sepulcri TaxID=359917 RepID=A0ABS7CGB3_9BACL|nr:hypothetical protein [Paenibacillus sepulcri]